ncbi:MAG: Phospholipase YtpA [Turneriella sp.]|nr:Phospholipase YtpA [Turneriella sp.]
MAKAEPTKKSPPRFHEDHLTFFRCSDGVERQIHIWGSDKPNAVFVAIHGGMAHAGDWVTPALYFKKKNWTTVAFDLNGHTGHRRIDIPSFSIFVDDLEIFIQWTKMRYPKTPIIILSHSMGALIAAHFALKKRPQGDEQIKGYIMSSPYFGNAIKVSPILIMLSKVFAALLPKMKVPLPSITGSLTHDSTITARHRQDEKDLLRASESSLRFGNELLRAQDQLYTIMARWQDPLFMVVAGNDLVADVKATEALAHEIDPQLLRYDYYPENYHENFNELNRNKIFKDIEKWVGTRLNSEKK